MIHDEPWVTLTRLAGADVVRLAGEIDLANAPAIADEVAVRTAGSSAVLVDLTAVTFLDSAGVRLLDMLVGDLEERGAGVRLVVAETGAVRMTLRLCAFREDLIDTDLDRAATVVGR